ncbi:hypothetical protein [Arthrobacter sp. MAHUQ-56]
MAVVDCAADAAGSLELKLLGATVRDDGYTTSNQSGSGRGIRRPQALLTAALLALEGAVVMVPIAARAAPADLPTATNCTARLLPGLGGRGSNAIAASSSGLVVGIADTSNGGSAPVLWQNGQPTALSIPLEVPVPASVNKDGVVVGTGYDASQEMLVGWWWQNGQYHPLDAGPGNVAMPSAISDSGVVAGVLVANEDHADGPGADEDEHPAVWSSVTAAPRELTLPAGARGGHPFAIGRDGTIGGVAIGDGGMAVLWAPDGTPKVLPDLAGHGGIVLAIDPTGQALGQSAVSEGTHAVAWGAAGPVTDLGAAAAGPASSAQGGAAGIAVGVGSTPSVRASRPQAVMWIGKSARVLPPGSDGQFTGVSGAATSVTGAGAATTVVGYSAAANGLRRATEWSCR